MLGQQEGGTGRLEEAIAAYRAALKERTRERVPLDWAQTQNNLGNTFAMLGQREGGTARLEEAVAAYQVALEELMRERVPLDWAVTTGSQGRSLMLLAERGGDLSTAEQALSQITAALEVSRDAGHAPYTAYFAQRAVEAQALIARLGKD
jgi:tetratricopeptide (TPR) repeat protein